jgi:hypothetical protein
MEGRGEEGVEEFEEMKASGVPPDDVVFIGVLTAAVAMPEWSMLWTIMKIEYAIGRAGHGVRPYDTMVQ